MAFSRSPVYHDIELLADLPGEVFSQKTALYERYFEPFCKIMDAEIQDASLLGKDRLYREYREIVQWPIRKLEYSFVLHHVLSMLNRQTKARVLDAGCGIAPLPHVLAMMGAEVDAVDYDEDTIQTLKMARVNEIYGFPANHQWMDIRRLAFPDATFDAVTCVSVLEHVGNGDEALALAEIMRVLKPGGKAILTTDVRGGDTIPTGCRGRTFDEPFSWKTLHDLLTPYAGMVHEGLHQLKILDSLDDEGVGRFWGAHWDANASWQGNRGYVAIGIVLSKTALPDRAERQADAPSRSRAPVESDRHGRASRDPDALDAMLRSEIRRVVALTRALEELEEKEAVIEEQKLALAQLRAHTERCPLGRLVTPNEFLRGATLRRFFAALDRVFKSKSRSS